MNSIDLLVRQLTGSLDWLKMTLSDFSDPELLTRPTPGANHVLWQLGHMIAGEVMMIGELKPGVMPELPAGFSDKFNKDTAKLDDAKQFGVGGKQQLLDLFTKVRNATIAYTKTLKPEDLDKPTPEHFKDYAPTVADLVALQPSHIMMHMGQIQVARRKLGKPVMF